MKRLTTAGKTKTCATVLLTLALLFALAGSSFAVTKDELMPYIFKSLGHKVPAKYLTDTDDEMTGSSALRLVFESMGWGFVITAYDQVTILPEWSHLDPVAEIAKKISPSLPSAILNGLERPLGEEDIKALTDWLELCRKKYPGRTHSHQRVLR